MSEESLDTKSFFSRWSFIWILIFLVSLTFSTALMEISFVMAFLGWLALKIKKKTPLLLEWKTGLPLLGFVVLCVLSFFWSEFPKQSLRGAFKILKQFFLFWMVAETFSDPSRHRLAFRVLVVTFLVLALDGMMQYVLGFDLIRHIPFEPASSGPRISATFKNYGLLASYLVTFLPILFSQSDKNEGEKFSFKRMLAIAFGLLLLFWTRMRGAWLAFGCGLVFYLLFERKKIYLLLLVLIALLGFFVLPRSMIVHLDAYGKEQSLVERFDLWERAIEVIRARPLTGTGINTYAVAHQKFDTRKSWRVRNYYAHNGYLQIAAETGLPSLLLFLIFVAMYFKKGCDSAIRLDESSKRTLVGILAGILNFLIYCLMDTVFHNPQAVMGWWFLTGWGIAYQKIASAPRD